ncbi:hypothetical protein COO60DRAFT_1700186 [Scenedesmus sp. NREL 46B-D3]|nr:hypothetical protein COO60DRAFT_1700186 [Scenedesmus sp. NREL 46B-D3]
MEPALSESSRAASASRALVRALVSGSSCLSFVETKQQQPAAAAAAAAVVQGIGLCGFWRQDPSVCYWHSACSARTAKGWNTPSWRWQCLNTQSTACIIDAQHAPERACTRRELWPKQRLRGDSPCAADECLLCTHDSMCKLWHFLCVPQHGLYVMYPLVCVPFYECWFKDCAGATVKFGVHGNSTCVDLLLLLLVCEVHKQSRKPAVKQDLHSTTVIRAAAVLVAWKPRQR